MDPKTQGRLVQVALDCFEGLEVLFQALYPWPSEGSVFLAGSLNTDAGDHPVPQDPREIHAAIEAARRCRDEFRYFEERYRERGRSFAQSDAAWLATLVQLPEVQAINQVEWLGRMLGNRGIPRLSLERQLELLHEELVAAVPEREAAYGVLLEASRHLERERSRQLPAAAFLRLAAAFRLETGNELEGRFAGMGALLVSAVCDQENGITEAVRSLQPWLSDPERFPPSWIAAVTRTLREAQAALA